MIDGPEQSFNGYFGLGHPKRGGDLTFGKRLLDRDRVWKEFRKSERLACDAQLCCFRAELHPIAARVEFTHFPDATIEFLEVGVLQTALDDFFRLHVYKMFRS